MGKTLTTYERIDAAFRHSEAGGVPLWGCIQHRPIYEKLLRPQHVGLAKDVSVDDKSRLHAEAYRKLGIDMCRAHLWPPDPGQAPYTNTTWAPRQTSAADIASYHPALPDEAARDEYVALRMQILRADWPEVVFAPTIRGIFCPVFEQMGLEEFSYACQDSPGEIERLVEAQTEYARALAERFAAHRAEVNFVAICDDMAFKGGMIFPPEWIRRFWRPRFEQVLAPLLKAGIRVIFHSDGNIREIIPDLIEMGIAGINPLEPVPGMELPELKRLFGKDLTFVGGVDCNEILPFAKPAEVREHVRRLLETGAPGGGYIIGDSSYVTPSTPEENVWAYYETVHEFNRR